MRWLVAALALYGAVLYARDLGFAGGKPSAPVHAPDATHHAPGTLRQPMHDDLGSFDDDDEDFVSAAEDLSPVMEPAAHDLAEPDAVPTPPREPGAPHSVLVRFCTQ